MPTQHTGLVDIQTSDAEQDTTIALNGDTAEVRVGGHGQPGELIIESSAGQVRFHLAAEGGLKLLKAPSTAGPGSVTLPVADLTRVQIRIGGDHDPSTRVDINGGNGDITLGGDNRDGDLKLRGGNGMIRVHLRVGGSVNRDARVDINGAKGDITLGGNDQDGDLKLRSGDGSTRVHLRVGGGVNREARVDINGEDGDIRLGGNGQDGDLKLQGTGGRTRAHLRVGGEADRDARIDMDGATGGIRLGGHDQDGVLRLRGTDGKTGVHLRAGGEGDSNAKIDVNGANGEIRLRKIVFLGDKSALTTGGGCDDLRKDLGLPIEELILAVRGLENAILGLGGPQLNATLTNPFG